MTAKHATDVLDDVRKDGAPFDDRKVQERYRRNTERNAKMTLNGLSVMDPASQRRTKEINWKAISVSDDMMMLCLP